MDDPTKREKISDAEKREYDMRRLDFFKATIAVTVIYATVIILISAVGIFSDEGYRFLFQDGYVFIVTLIIGVILIVALLLYRIYTYKMQKKTVVSGDSYVCPDYWELKKTPDSILQVLQQRESNLSAKTPGNVKNLSTYYCEDTRAKERTGNMTVRTTDPVTTENTRLTFIANDVYGTSSSNPLDANYTMNCSRLYPAYLESQDTTKTGTNVNKIDNKIRCEYLKQCREHNDKNVIWSCICPN